MEFLVENENEIVRNIRKADDFIEDSFEYIPLGVRLSAVVGVLRLQEGIDQRINPEKKSVQSVRFEKPDWDLEAALAWLQENQKKFESVEAVKKYERKAKSIKGVEIFSAGVWNGDKYTVQDLDQMIEAFEETHQTVRPFLKLGHDDKQALLQESGLPAAGWIEKIYRKGEKLVADFADIPSKVYELIEKKAYRKVSCEIYMGVSIGKRKFDKLIGACALLGAETPGVMNLSDILAQYGFQGYDEVKSYFGEGIEKKVYNFENKFMGEDTMSKTEREIELEAKLKQMEEAAEKFDAEKKEFSKKEDEMKTLAEEKAELEKKVFEAEMKAKKEEIERQADQLVNEKLMPKGLKEYAVKLLSDEPETKKYSFGEGEEAKEISKFEMIQNFCKGMKASQKVNFEDSSEGGPESKSDTVSMEEVEKYAKENEVSLSDAYRELFRGKLQPTEFVADEEEQEDEDEQ